MDLKTLNERQISHKGETLFNNIPEGKDIITVVYASYDDIFLFDVTGLLEEDINELLKELINTIQSGTNVKREVAKKIGSTYFIY